MGRKIVGLLMIAGSVFLFYLAYQASHSVGDATKHFFTGDYRQKTYWFIGSGVALAVLAIVGLVVPVRQTRPFLS